MKRDLLVRKMAETLGISLEDADAAIPKDQKPELSTEERLLEAQATLNYFLYRGPDTFYRVICKQCHQPFRYDYNYLGITMCSVECMSQALEARGLKWSPDRPLYERWGYTAAPAVVPAPVVALVDKLLEEGHEDPEIELDFSDDSSSQLELANTDVDSHLSELDQFLGSLDL